MRSFIDEYTTQVCKALRGINKQELERAVELIRNTIKSDNLIYACGNGGSAAIANHLVCDCSKGIRSKTNYSPRVISLSNSVELITAIGNDLSFERIFSYQIESMARKGDLLITISSSGNSENIIQAINSAYNIGIPVIAMTGFDGGRSRKMVDINLHIDSCNYGVIEDCHQSLMHIMAQALGETL